MKPDKDLTVEEWREEFHERIGDAQEEALADDGLEPSEIHDMMHKAEDAVIRRIQRTYFDKGAKAQREVDRIELRQFAEEWMGDIDRPETLKAERSAIIECDRVLTFAPLVEFEEEE